YAPDGALDGGADPGSRRRAALWLVLVGAEVCRREPACGQEPAALRAIGIERASGVRTRSDPGGSASAAGRVSALCLVFECASCLGTFVQLRGPRHLAA